MSAEIANQKNSNHFGFEKPEIVLQHDSFQNVVRSINSMLLLQWLADNQQKVI